MPTLSPTIPLPSVARPNVMPKSPRRMVPCAVKAILVSACSPADSTPRNSTCSFTGRVVHRIVGSLVITHPARAAA
jgi:hypothetical protein